VALAGLALTVLASLPARDGGVPAAERTVFRWLNELPAWLERTMWALQLLGVLVTPIVIAAVVLLVLRRWRLALALVALAPLKLVAEREVLKKLVERQRPGQNEPGAILRDVPPAGLSFPSGHAMIAVGMAVLLWPYLGRTGRVVAVLLAVAVGVARIYLGAHNPLDVVAGAGLGLLLGGLLTLLVGIPRRR
jgi:undecaprenyl-diphosphatase